LADQPAFAHVANGADAAVLDEVVAQRRAFRGRDFVGRAPAGGKNGRELMARQGQRQRGKIELFLPRLIAAAVVNGNPQRILQPHSARPALRFAVRPEIVRRVRDHRQVGELDGVGLLDGESRVHVLHRRGFLPDRAVGRAVGGSAATATARSNPGSKYFCADQFIRAQWIDRTDADTSQAFSALKF
jgi:hypothetical protein